MTKMRMLAILQHGKCENRQANAKTGAKESSKEKVEKAMLQYFFVFWKDCGKSRSVIFSQIFNRCVILAQRSAKLKKMSFSL